MGKIPSLNLDISIAHFRGEMDRLLAINGEEFCIETKKIKYKVTYFSYAQTTTREVWNIFPIVPMKNGKNPGNSKFAMILATENKINNTVVEFLDGRCYERVSYHFRSDTTAPNYGPPHLANHEEIGGDFILLCDILRNMILHQIGTQSQSYEIEEPKSRNLEEWFNYFHVCGNIGVRFSLKDISKKTNYSYSYIRRKHSEYIAEHENKIG